MNPPALPPLPPPPPPSGSYPPPPGWGDQPPAYEPMPAVPGWPKVMGWMAVGVGVYGLFTHGFGMIAMPAAQKLMASAPHSSGVIPATVWEELGLFQFYNGLGCLLLGVLLIAGGIALVRSRPISRGLLLSWAVLRIALAALTAPMFYSYTKSMMASTFAGIPTGAPVAPGSTPAAVPPTVVATPPLSAPADPSAPTEPTSSGSSSGKFTLRSSSAPPVGAPSSPPAAPTPPPFPMASLSSTIAIFSFGFGLLMTCLFPLFTLFWFNMAKVKELVASWKTTPVSPPIT